MECSGFDGKRVVSGAAFHEYRGKKRNFLVRTPATMKAARSHAVYSTSFLATFNLPAGRSFAFRRRTRPRRRSENTVPILGDRRKGAACQRVRPRCWQ
jgi:hypothetical protein